MTAEVILAWMITLQAPGASSYSAVAERQGVVCDSEHTAGCRRETVDEGLDRYQTIARSLARIEDQRTARMALTVVYHESGFRRDVHLGTGRWARGDQGRSWCLGQLLVGRTGARGKRLVGLDQGATDRCVDAVVRVLGAVQHDTPYTRLARYGGVWCSDDSRILSRVATFRRLQGPAPKLDAVLLQLLGGDA